jgi:hypothetical protein
MAIPVEENSLQTGTYHKEKNLFANVTGIFFESTCQFSRIGTEGRKNGCHGFTVFGKAVLFSDVIEP